uniref:SHSP domain-containing protein n=1 Tax=Clastoptera arizonana TaxID=38151 RepID=A0A1B6DWS0_9HEMI
MTNCFQPLIVQRGNFLSDPYFVSARTTLEHLSKEMQQAKKCNMQWQSNSTEFLLSQLSAWQHSSQKLDSTISTIRLSDIMNTVFKFEPDHFKMLIDVRGFQPTELKISVNQNAIDIKACKEERAFGECSSGYASRVIERTYQLPQPPKVETMQCSMSGDGILFVCASWSI